MTLMQSAIITTTKKDMSMATETTNASTETVMTDSRDNIQHYVPERSSNMASVFNVYGIADDAKEWYAQ
jgi:hypothetical protein